jgi:hypothetical protein
MDTGMTYQYLVTVNIAEDYPGVSESDISREIQSNLEYERAELGIEAVSVEPVEYYRGTTKAPYWGPKRIE